MDVDEDEMVESVYERGIHATADSVAGSREVFTNEKTRDKDIIGHRAIVVVRRSEKSTSVGLNFQDSMSGTREIVSLIIHVKVSCRWGSLETGRGNG
jgi:hypothetical protein